MSEELIHMAGVRGDIAAETTVTPLSPPGYELLDEIGHGGMGVVYRARDVALDRDVAVKLLSGRYAPDSVAAQRFLSEARITGQLQHPGIPAVHQMGTLADGRPFLAMKLIKGCTLEVILKERPDPSADRGTAAGGLAIFEAVCQAIGYAHAHRVIHRDLKPAYVMVGAFGEVQVMDWGLAKVLGEGSLGTTDVLSAEETQAWAQVSPAPSSGSHTQAGSLIGTPAFIPPEQAGGEIERVNERADVFGLGALLSVILTGKPLYVGETFESVRVQALRGKLDHCFARLDACGAEPELVALCKKCLAFEPADRPADAGAVAAAVAALRAAADERARQAELERVRAEGETREALARAAEQRRRRRILLTACGIIALVFLLGFAGVFWQWRVADTARGWAETEATRATEQKRLAEDNLTKAEKAEKEATQQRDRADDAAERTRQNLYYAQMHLTQQAWREYRGLPHMRELLANWVPKAESPDRRGWEWFYLNSLPYQNLRTFTESESSTFVERVTRESSCTVAWHISSNRLAEGTVDGLIRIWDVDRERTMMSVQGPAPVYWWGWGGWLAWSPDGAKLAGGGKDGTVHVWETVSGRELHVHREHKSPIWSVAFSADGTRLAAWGEDGTIKIWDANTGPLTAEVAHPGDVHAGAWSPDDKLLASGHGDGTVTVSGTQAGDKMVTLRGHVAGINRVVWGPDGTRLASASQDFTARIWNVASEKVVLGPLRHSLVITALAWEPDGQRLATGSADNMVKIWNATTGSEVVTLRGHFQAVTSLSWGPGGRLASGCRDGSMRIWTSGLPKGC